MDCNRYAILTLKEVTLSERCITYTVCGKGHEATAVYDTSAHSIVYSGGKVLTDYLISNESQFLKVLRSRERNFPPSGPPLTFVLIDNKNTAAFRDPSRVIRIDRTEGRYCIDTAHEVDERIPRVYVDGSYLPSENAAAVAAVWEYGNGELYVYAEPVEERNSNLIEMLSVIRGLEKPPAGRGIRIITDSLYIRRGLAEWIVHWKLNDWRTARGAGVKHAHSWKRLDRLMEGRCVELQWIKRSSRDPRHVLCDASARRAAREGSGFTLSLPS